MPSRHWLYFGGFVVTALLAVGAALLGLLEGLAALSGGVPASEELVVLTMLGAAAEWVLIVLVLGVVATLFLVATVVSVLRTASLPRDDRLVTLVAWLEHRYPILRQFDVRDYVAPTVEDLRQQLKERYVAGELSEAEFERGLAELLDDGADDSAGADNGTTIEIEGRSR